MRSRRTLAIWSSTSSSMTRHGPSKIGWHAQVLLPALIAILATGCGPETPLHRAAREGNAQQVSKAIKWSRNIDKHGPKGHTPLHGAAVANKDQGAQVQLEHQAQIESLDKDENTPLHLAARSNS